MDRTRSAPGADLSWCGPKANTLGENRGVLGLPRGYGNPKGFADDVLGGVGDLPPSRLADPTGPLDL